MLTERRGAELSVETIIVEPSFETSRWAYKHPFRLCRAPLYNLELVRAQSSSMTD